jgi:CDP-4-dehydro-6-deoxyglucose reductase, E3
MGPILGLMNHNVTLEPSADSFENPADQSLLESALNAGLPVSYGCSNGNCGQCKATLLRGDVQSIRHSDYCFSVSQKQAGAILMCTNTAASDVVIRTTLANHSEDIALQTIEVKVKKLIDLGHGFTQLLVQTPRTQRLRFLAGHGAVIVVNDKLYFLSIASCPCDDRNIHFHISRNDHENADLKCLKTSDRIELRAPYGNFVLDRHCLYPRIMISDIDGLAPLKSIIEHSLSIEPDQAVHIVVVSDQGVDHYLHNLLRSWQDVFDTLQYQCVTSREFERLVLNDLVDDPLQTDFYIAANRSITDHWISILRDADVASSRVHFQTSHADRLTALRSKE